MAWRQGFKPTLRAFGRAEFNLITALSKGLAVEAALDQAWVTESAFDFNSWLGAAVQTGLITGAAQVAI